MDHFLHWMTSYLSNGNQYVQIDYRNSALVQPYFGVPQGSILGPLLFDTYVSDFSDNLGDSTVCYQYADDTTV